jgi:hypothetical protein
MTIDQGYLHALLEHPETNISMPGIEPGPPASQASKELFEQLMLFLFGTSTDRSYFYVYVYNN